MPISIYNTLTKKKELFQTIEPEKVLMYVCGPTVYDSCHIGHARSVVVFDVIFRYLKTHGYDVVYVRNFTDIDDKIIRRAAEIGMDPKVLADKYIDEFYRDMDALHVERASFEPRVTEHIDDVVQLVEKLIAKKFAYTVDGDVFYAVEAFDAYGKLSNRRLEDMDPGARVEIDPRKRNPFDFILWKAAKPGEPSWDSPWGKGRPGWHIECSAMSARYLGETFDIHGGGRDLIFPHHENEIAQSEAAHGREFVRYWIHNGFVNIDKEKMSKSLGNFRMIKDVIQQYHPEVIRLFLLSKQYRKPIDFSQASMEASRTALDRIYALLLRIDETIAGAETSATAPEDMPFWKMFCQAMDDDFNTANGIAVIFNAVRHANRIMDENENDTTSRNVVTSLSAIKLEILRMGAVLGIGSDVPDAYFHVQRESVLAQGTTDVKFIEALIADREVARQEKNWERADQIREQLASMSIVLKDRPDGTHWNVEK
ncbi:MAG: cysteine--tRNA ligase [Deltaproteobacteria bacterium]|nr:MAG: cysteine--tRNA ligase [Deltaproteobacteria bacterium]